MKEFYTVEDIEKILDVSRAKAYKIIRSLNKELNEEGYKTLKGRVNKIKFDSRYIYKGERNEVV
ncbi:MULTISPECIES: ICEBs1 excisionase [Bacillus]|uniref:ICEBs1 excisionase n=1 Tax=Bacillus TaxID=1386 RepID=UPI002DB7D626|nr:ICEBs1 excisionase [Bacillus halotolerans]MEC3637305.1 ICEBs1 excisionase [Bacillus halotolerans]